MSSIGPLRNANATMLLASAANSGSNVIFRLGIGVSQTRKIILRSTPARQSFGRRALGDFSGRLSLTDQTMLCYNLHAGHGQMLRVVGLPVRTRRDVLP